MIFIFLAEAAWRRLVVGWEEGGVGRSVGALVQTSGPMEASVVF